MIACLQPVLCFCKAGEEHASHRRSDTRPHSRTWVSHGTGGHARWSEDRQGHAATWFLDGADTPHDDGNHPGRRIYWARVDRSTIPCLREVQFHYSVSAPSRVCWWRPARIAHRLLYPFCVTGIAVRCRRVFILCQITCRRLRGRRVLQVLSHLSSNWLASLDTCAQKTWR